MNGVVDDSAACGVDETTQAWVQREIDFASAVLTRPQPRDSNACKSDTSQKLILKFKLTVLEGYWELGARIETTSPGSTRL